MTPSNATRIKVAPWALKVTVCVRVLDTLGPLSAMDAKAGALWSTTTSSSSGVTSRLPAASFTCAKTVRLPSPGASKCATCAAKGTKAALLSATASLASAMLTASVEVTETVTSDVVQKLGSTAPSQSTVKAATMGGTVSRVIVCTAGAERLPAKSRTRT